jgi:hypothetical protein
MPSDSKRKHAAADEEEVRVDVEAIVDGAEQKKGGGSSTLFVSNLPYTGSSLRRPCYYRLLRVPSMRDGVAPERRRLVPPMKAWKC